MEKRCVATKKISAKNSTKIEREKDEEYQRQEDKVELGATQKK